MQSILDPEHWRVIEAFITRDTLLAFEYDGTLAPIVAQRSDARMRPRTRELLVEAARRYATVAITGRSRIEALRFLAGLHLLEVVGNHGFEALGASPRSCTRRVESWYAALAARFRALPGVAIEFKRYSLTIHYRASDDMRRVASEIRCAAEALEDARVTDGHLAVNVLPIEAPSKVDALRSLRRRLGCSRVLFVGNGDAADGPPREGILAVRIGGGDMPAPDCPPGRQEDIDGLLVALNELRSAHATQGPGCAA